MTFSSRLEQIRVSGIKRRFGLISIFGLFMLRVHCHLPSRDFNLFLRFEDNQFDDIQDTEHFSTASYSGVRETDSQVAEPISGEPITVTYYTLARIDRVGACLQDMLQGHAYAWREKQVYGGACINHTAHPERHKSLQKVTAALGLSSELPLACPPPGQESADAHVILPAKLYRRKDAKLFSPRWLAYMRQKVRKAWNDYHAAEVGSKNRALSTAVQLAVHIRRGDVQPCNKNSLRFLPNSHYIDLIRKYLTDIKSSLPVQSKVDITIFSEKNAGIEGWDGLREALEENKALATYSFALDTDIIDVFRRLVSADAIILSISSFSLTGAVLNFKQENPSPVNKIVYTPFWRDPLDPWTVVSQSQLNKTERDIHRIAELSGCSSDERPW
jgi:hypothetical protein